jgi:hypothetical protein
MGIMTTRRLGIALVGMALTVAVVFVPACEYDPHGQPQPGQPASAPTSTRVVDTPPAPVSADLSARPA